LLQLIYAPHEIFLQTAKPVKEVNDDIRFVIDNMFSTLRVEKGVGLGANMVGILERIIVVSWEAGDARFSMINPEITYRSEETQEHTEASLSFPGIEAKITRPKKIKVSYLDYSGNKQEMEYEGFLATIIQHEIDYLDGKIFLDYLSKIKRDRLLKKMQKHQKNHPPHIHGEHCNH
jgi:peptide deformylase